MPTINDLRQQAATIKNATQVGENTATRVGTTFETIADLLEGMGGVTNLSTIDIGSIDTLNTTGDMLVGTPNIYTLTKTIGANTFKVGTLFQFANNGRYDVAQVVVSQFIVDADGRIDTTSADQEVHIFYRLCKTMNGGSLPTPIGTWTTWTELGGSGGSGVTIDPYPTQNSGNAVSSGGVFERLQDVAPKVDISAIDDIDEYSDMLATKSPFYVVTKTLSGNVFRIGTLMEFANQGRYILYQILATDYVLNDDGTLDTTLSENGGLKLIWRMKQFSGNPPAGVTIGVWSAWAKFGDSGYQPDNEDIDLNANDQLQFANKAYDASAFSGLGRVYLRKNIVQLNLTDKYFDGFVNDVLVQDVGTSSTPDAILFDTTRKMFVARVGLLYYVDWSSDEDYNPITRDVNWNYNGNFYRWNGEELVQWDKTINQLTQAMVNTANTIYHIQYDYDLNGHTITLPAGCVLEFEGGSLANGTIVGNGTKIEAGLNQIFGTDVTISGTWNVSETYPEWFGAKGDGITDDRDAFNLALSVSPTMKLRPVIYAITGDRDDIIETKRTGIVALDNMQIFGNGATIKVLATALSAYNAICCYNISNFYISNLRIIGDKDEHVDISHEGGMGIGIYGSTHGIIENCYIEKCIGDGLYLNGLSSSSGEKCENISIINCKIDKCNRNGISVICAENIIIDGCSISEINGAPNGPFACIDVEPNSVTQEVKNITIQNCDFQNGRRGGISFDTNNGAGEISGFVSNVNCDSTLRFTLTNPQSNVFHKMSVRGCKFGLLNINVASPSELDIDGVYITKGANTTGITIPSIVSTAKVCISNTTIDCSETTSPANGNAPIYIYSSAVYNLTLKNMRIIEGSIIEPIVAKDNIFDSSCRIDGVTVDSNSQKDWASNKLGVFPRTIDLTGTHSGRDGISLGYCKKYIFENLSGGCSVFQSKDKICDGEYTILNKDSAKNVYLEGTSTNFIRLVNGTIDNARVTVAPNSGAIVKCDLSLEMLRITTFPIT